MGDPYTRIEESPAQVQIQVQVPLLDPEHNKEENEKDIQLDRILRRLDIFLCFFGFYQSSLLGFLLSWAAFLLLGVSVPLVLLRLSNCSDCEKYLIYNTIELDIIISQASLAAVSLGCISQNLRKYGTRNFLFVDRLHGQMLSFQKEYTEKIQGFFRSLVLWILPCILLRTAHEVIRIIKMYHHDFWWQSVVMLLALVSSRAFLTTISLSACLLFNLVCNLQVIHLDNYRKLLESDSDVSVFIEEHLHLRHHLSKISHRFRVFLILAFLVATANQFVTLFRATASSRFLNFIIEGDFAVFSVIQVVGIILCLNAAAKISHRAQGITSFACKWHALLTCNFNDASELSISNGVGNIEATDPSGSLPKNNSVGNSEATNPSGSFPMIYPESDLDSLDYPSSPINTQTVSCLCTYHKRQSLVTYLQSNPGGITIFGWMVDRTLINTLFCLEFSLVLFVLGKTVIFTSP